MKLPDVRYTISFELTREELQQLQEMTLRMERDPTDWQDLERVAKAIVCVEMQDHMKRGAIHTLEKRRRAMRTDTKKYASPDHPTPPRRGAVRG